MMRYRKGDGERSSLFTRRSLLLGGAQALLLSALAGRLYQLQVLETQRFSVQAEENRINLRLLQAERQFIDEGGLPRRPWYRHLLYAPGFYTGYGVQTMPGVREGIEQKRYEEAEKEAARLAAALVKESALINEVAADLEKK